MIILSSTITLPQPVAVCAAEPEVTAVGVPIVFDGRASFHENPFRTIARYELRRDNRTGWMHHAPHGAEGY